MLDRCNGEAQAILRDHRDQLELVTGELLKQETLDARAFEKLIGQPAALTNPAAGA